MFLSLIASFPVFIFAHMVSPLSSDLQPAPHPKLSFICLRSQRHCQTGGGVKRRWAPGDPRGAFQWQGPQVKTSRAEQLEENKAESHADMFD